MPIEPVIDGQSFVRGADIRHSFGGSVSKGA